MKKLFFTLIGLMFAVSTAFASPSDKVNFTTISKTDSQVLFGKSQTSATIIKEKEMINTKGELWWSSFRWRQFKPSLSFPCGCIWNPSY